MSRAAAPAERRGQALLRLALASLVALAAACASFPEVPEEERWPAPRRGVVVSEHPLASAVGRDVLAAGGNAVDAAVATAFALAVVLPEAGNLGGGGFAIAAPHDPRARPLAIDFRETAPAALSRDAFLDESGAPDPERSLRTALAVGTPGTVAGLHLLHDRGGGRLAWSAVVEPAIELARDGFRVDPWLARRLRRPDLRERLEAGGAGDLLFPLGAPLREGDLLVQRELARTLERIARQGPPGFYRGPVAEALVRDVRERGGVLALADLASYEAVEREALRGWFRGIEVITMPPPSSGGVALLQALSILDGFPLAQERERALAARAAAGEADPDDLGLSGRAVHWWIEALRRAFADRAMHLGDPDAHDVPLDRLLAPGWIAERRVSIGERAAPGVAPMPAEEPAAPPGGDTTHLSVLDAEGNAVALTTTLNTLFGTGILVPGAGVLLNNQVDDFAVHPGEPNVYGLVGWEANALAPGKRPLSSMTPTVLRDGGRAVTAVLGARGGPRIISAVLQVVLRTEVYGQPLADAVAAPRLHQQWRPEATRFEPGWDARLLQELAGRGHVVELLDEPLAGVQAIRLEVGGEPRGVSDPRTGGAPAAVGRPAGTPAPPPDDAAE